MRTHANTHKRAQTHPTQTETRANTQAHSYTHKNVLSTNKNRYTIALIHTLFFYVC